MEVTDEDVYRLSSGRSGISRRQLAKDFITPVNVFYTAGWAVLIAVACYKGTSWMNYEMQGMPVPQFYLTR